MRHEDQQLLEGFLAGHDEAVHRVDVWIRRAASSYRGRLVDEWDDLCQELRLEVMRNLEDGGFRGDSRLRTWIWRVVGHTCLDRIRSRNRWRWTDLEDAPSRLASSSRLPGELERRDLLARLWQGMSEDCRRLWMMIAAGLSYREMSDRVGGSEGALRVRVLRCRRKASEAREILEEDRNESVARTPERSKGDEKSPSGPFEVER